MEEQKNEFQIYYWIVSCPGRQIAVSGVSNILRFLCRQQGYSSLYNEEQLETAALLDEILSLVDSLEVRVTWVRHRGGEVIFLVLS